MRFVDLARMCHPVLITNDDETYWIGQNGTCFIVSRAGRLFAITARHCVRPASVSDLRIACYEGAFAPLIAGYQRTRERTTAEDQEDLYIVELDQDRMGVGYRAALKFVDMDSDPPMHLLNIAPEPEIAIPGFPKDRSGIDYEGKILAPKPTILAAWYLGRGIETGCYDVKFTFEDLSLVPSLDGFSGSPVFWVPKAHGTRCFTLVGMLIRGNTSWGSFLGASAIARGIDSIVTNNPR